MRAGDRHSARQLGQPAIDILRDLLLLRALVGLRNALSLEHAVAGIAVRVHSPLQRITLPAEDVVAVRAVSGEVTIAPYERLAAVLGPEALVVEGSGVPDDLVEKLRNLDWVASRAGAVALESTAGGISNMRGVVCGVQVLAVPAGREADIGHDALLADPVGHGLGLTRAGVERVQAREGQLAELAGGRLVAEERVADDHAEAGLEGGHLGPAIGGRVVDGHTAAAGTVEEHVGTLGNTLEGAVASAEEEGSGPVVGEVLGELARGASGLLGNVVTGVVHGDVEGVAADDLVEMGGLGGTGEDETRKTDC